MNNGDFCGISVPCDKPIFIISLDTELLYAYIGAYPSHETVSSMKNNCNNVRSCIDILLKLFQKYKIPATWAIIGHLFLDHCEKKDGVPHKDMPRFKEDWYFSDPCTDIEKDPLYYGRDIVEDILASLVKHEIGYHSFSDVVFSECGREVAEAEIKEGIKLARNFGITLKSFIFPRNKIGHIDLLKKYGFEIYRGENLGRYALSENMLIRKFNGAIDKIITPPAEPQWMNGIWEISSSMFFYDPQIKFSLLPRAKLGLHRVMRSKKVFHIFLHPHNLLMYSSLRDDLDKFLRIVTRKRNEGKIEVITMGGLVTTLTKRKEINL